LDGGDDQEQDEVQELEPQARFEYEVREYAVAALMQKGLNEQAKFGWEPIQLSTVGGSSNASGYHTVIYRRSK